MDEDELELTLQRALDPVLQYKPGPTQTRALHSRIRYRAVTGGNRTGKTTHVAVECAMAARRLHPVRSIFCKPVTYLVLAPTREQLQDPWEKKLLKNCELRGHSGRPLIPEWEIKKVWYTHGAGAPTIRQIDMLNGHTIKFAVSKDVESWKRRQGQAIAAIFPDESEGSVQMMNEWYARLLDANDDPDIIREAGGGWILWGFTPTTANPAATRFLELCDSADPKAADWEAFRISSSEAVVSKAERERLRVALSEEDYQVRMEGEASFLDRLLIYGKQWRDARHMLTTDYVVQPSDNIWISYDPGGAGKESHDTGILFCAVRKEEPKKLYHWKYVRLNRTTLGYDVALMAKILKGRPIEGLIPDPAINKTEKATGKSLRQQLREEMHKHKIVCHRGLIHVLNRHDPGIKRVQTYLERDLIAVSPSHGSGGQLVRQGMVSYRSYEPGVYQGAHGVVKTDDESVDCLAAGTLIRVESGEKPIEEVAIGELVWTRRGLRPVTDAWCSSDSSPTYDLVLEDGTVITATGGHHFWIEGRGFVRLDSIEIGDVVLSCQTSEFSRGRSTTSTTAPVPVTSEIGVGSCSTGRFTRPLTVQSSPGSMSTTGTAIGPTTISRISKPWTSEITCGSTWPSARMSQGIWPGFGHSPFSGIDPLKDGPGTASTAARRSPSVARSITPVSTAEAPIGAGIAAEPGSAATHVGPALDTSPALMTRTGTALSAGPCSAATATSERKLARVRVMAVRRAAPRQVFDLTVDGEHEFFANGVLVHNCLRYLAQAAPLWVPRPCGDVKWQGDDLPPPPPPMEPPVLSEDQSNYQLQLQRSQRLTAPLNRRRVRN